MNLNDFSYMDIYNHRLRIKQQYRNAIPKGEITTEVRQLWGLED